MRRNQIPVVRRVPESDAGGKAHRLAGGIPCRIRNVHFELAPLEVDGDRRRRRHGSAACRVDQLRLLSVHREEERRRAAHVRAARKFTRCRRIPDRDRKADARRILQTVERDSKYRLVAVRLDA